MAETRKLLAILAADVVGYSRLTGADEEGTLARLRALRTEVLDPAFELHAGRVFKRTGDGAMVEFRSAVEAVRCALAVQAAMAERVDDLPDDKRLVLRIGVHVGDVVEEADGDLMGDGVNIAARLEGIAPPGGICLSEDAYRSVRGRLGLNATDMGPTALKNIAEPMRTYVLGSGPAAPAVAPKTKRRSYAPLAIGLIAFVAIVVGGWFVYRSRVPASAPIVATAPARLSIVVLPFSNLSGDPEQDYFADAITDDLTTDLSHLPDSFVIARNTAFTYKGKPVDVKELGRELGVRYVLEGSVRRAGETISINAQLISAETGAHVWADRFEGERNRLGPLQVEVVTRLSRSLGVEMVKAESLRALRERPDNPDAVDLAMQGWAQYNLPHTRDSIGKAIELFERAVALDPNQARALAGLSLALSARAINLWSQDRNADLKRAAGIADKLIADNPDDAIAHLAKAGALGGMLQWDAAMAETRALIEADTNIASAYADNGYQHIFVGQAEEGIAPIETALRLSPRDPLRFAWEYWLCHIYSHLARWQELIDWCRKSTAENAANWFPWADLAAAYGWLGEFEQAKAAIAELLKLNPKFTVKGLIGIGKFFSNNAVFTEQLGRIAEGLRKAGAPEG